MGYNGIREQIAHQWSNLMFTWTPTQQRDRQVPIGRVMGRGQVDGIMAAGPP
jgi:hypothetical protein